MKRKKPELLAPAGNMEKLKMAILYGADAVYLGGEAYGLRAQGGNFSREELAEAARFAHARGKKIYATVNVYPRNEELAELPKYLRFLQEIGADAILVSDLGVFSTAREVAPELPVHISTQANTVNYAAVNAWARLGAERVVLARELSIEEIREIRRRCDVELEMFVHGAMCVSYSGRCLMSNYFTGRDANRGDCAQACRWRYALMEETRPGEYFPVMENERGTFIFNSKDLCMIEHIPELIEAGIDSFKVEGRMKTALYVAVAARTYREAIDDHLKDPALFRNNLNRYLEEISKCTYRQFCTGFFFGKPSGEDQIYDSSTYVSEYTYLGLVSGVLDGRAVITQKNKFCVGDRIEIMKPDGRNTETTVISIRNEEGGEMESAPHPGQKLFVKMDADCEPYDILRTPKARP